METINLDKQAEIQTLRNESRFFRILSMILGIILGVILVIYIT